ncbi:hypothetical protein AG1IA_05692 [Rhizoctonia solani AG-1 IA]|uniref:Uncharacterized protein n=1 Tax=Thanatephorus cucumeris (strain AG1-IA) TaxID=983506 RepID=L8WU39_THACA|nr:hypothetical protein AG1IA_05692 [Rhizoctonia solani AG-1 IA]
MTLTKTCPASSWSGWTTGASLISTGPPSWDGQTCLDNYEMKTER